MENIYCDAFIGTKLFKWWITLSFYLPSLTTVLKKDMEVIDVVNDKRSGYSFKIYDYKTDNIYNTKEICDRKHKGLY